MAIHPQRILFEDAHLLVVNKLPGELVVAAGGGGGGRRAGEGGRLALFDFLRKQYPGLRVLHRLDYGTSGVVLFARSAAALRAVRASAFQNSRKRYIALVAGRVERPQGEVRVPLPARTRSDLVPAVTRYRVMRQFRDATLLECEILTGRRHQIRQHCAKIGHPLLCDPLYGDRRRDRTLLRLGYRRFFLHAASLDLPHPITGVLLHIAAPLPASFAEALERLGR